MKMAAAPGLMTAVESYFQAWNSRDPDAVPGVFAEGGTYADPTIADPPLPASGLAAHVRGVLAAFPDLSFEILSAQPLDSTAGSGTAVARWLMRGTNTGPLRGNPPTGRPVALGGVDIITVADGEVATVEGYFDRQAMAEQLGLQVIVQPHAAGPFEFGYGVRASGHQAKPGAVSLTWIEARSPEEANEIRGISRPLAAELTSVPGCVSLLGSGFGDRMYLTAVWENKDAVGQVWRSSLHEGAVKRFFTEDFAAAIGTAVFTVDHVNAVWMRCTACAAVVNRTDNATCPCGQPLPEPVW
jgi:steroid delta-isomerase-like uncharacterized protein